MDDKPNQPEHVAQLPYLNPDWKPRERHWHTVEIVAEQGSEIFTELDADGYLVLHLKAAGGAWPQKEASAEDVVTKMELGAVCFCIRGES